MRYLVMLGGLFCLGCTSVLDGLATNHYERHYIADIEVTHRDPEGHPAPTVQRVFMRHHDRRLETHRSGGWQVLGSTEFNTSNSPRENHLLNLGRKLGATLVVHSREFDRREQRMVKRREYQEGQRVRVNDTTVELPGRWVDVVDVETYEYHDYRATFLRPAGE